MWRDPGTPSDSYYQVRPECTDVPKTKFTIKAGKTLSVRKWQAAFTPEGHLDIGRTLSRIYRGGVHPTIRGEVWEFLLGCYDSQSTFEEREQIRQRRRAQYAVLKEECHQNFPIVGSGRFITAPVIAEDGDPILDPIVLLEANPDKGPASLPQENGNADSFKPATGMSVHANALNYAKTGTSYSSAMGKEVDKKIIQWKLTLHQIGLDVVRTDRTLVFYEKQENLSKLWDILAVYAWFDTDVGYCQGMSDLCSPMIILLEDEADAFWCFEHLMRRLRGNFRCTESSVGVESQLSNLASITQVIDPKLHQHLETLGGGDYLFAFRMLMVLFRREFSFGDSLYLWEMMWALEYDPDLFTLYEDPDSAEGSKGKPKSIRQCGKFEREILKNRAKSNEAPLPISVFLVASVLKDRSTKLLTEARGLDDVVKILNDITGNLDAKKACSGAMKLQKKYLKKAKKP
ncbi:rab GTPase-activating protein 22-like [Actinidia eriantha]|uniref:rab GTPase-activating protein 22-like n=1 Tax=Actinidia eriantha TaxID=165200 RepID=UPI00258D128E|nr:rab GTPase-activating protein 22-like [Actinidia eriantha]